MWVLQSHDSNMMRPRIWTYFAKSVLVNIPLDHIFQDSMMYRRKVYTERQGRYAAFCTGCLLHCFTVQAAFGEVHESWFAFLAFTCWALLLLDSPLLEHRQRC
ncbi:hypothetical protein BKA82DRAFT_735439 [Pisolithus tinctorius]|uniref:Uncharacterized protein n=1 Tax=Pisolithus tinctorius Marx 270 TaxID=870435 RepID=A0A0C3P1W1_PISTI|nr:hypothetical protein BKA82DRAFT_735439 [Pisolithus tinctorius]KIO01486.1 hypothetical protein M404DRAFT_735439 [Pisolithus tinctorius Marx 270]